MVNSLYFLVKELIKLLFMFIILCLLGDKSIGGPLVSGLCKFISLSTFIVSRNLLTGTIPTILTCLTNIQSFSVDSSVFLRKVPSFFLIHFVVQTNYAIIKTTTTTK